MMKTEKQGHQKAGGFALLCLLMGLVSPFIPSSGAGYFVSPLFVLLGLGAGWFWFKGRFGTDKDKEWVNDHF